MATRGTHHFLTTLVRLLFGTVATAGLMAAPAMAQETKPANKPDSVFDDEKKDDKKDEKKADKTKPAGPSDRETIGFGQQNVASQMNELEERMFRLSEALRGLEPENASRLRLALQFSREEQILEQMRETYKFLKEAQLSKAETEVKELIAKLQHLRNLLLAEDLDFQLKLARLRQMRETLGQLERIINEEKRELGWSRFAMEQRKRLERFSTRKPDLQKLVSDQQSVVDDTKKAIASGAKPAKEARDAIRGREVKIRNGTAGLASDPLFSDLQPPHLRRADGHLADAVSQLEGTDGSAAVASEEKALGLLREEATRLDDTVAQTEKTIADPEFRRRAEDQAKNRGATELLDESSARLGDVGVTLRKDLIRAAASMKSAEQGLGKSAAPKAADDQSNRARSTRQVARGASRIDREAPGRASHRAPVTSRRRADRDARDSDGDPRIDPGKCAASVAKVPHGTPCRGRSVQAGRRARRTKRALACLDRRDRVWHRAAHDAAHPRPRNEDGRDLAGCK